MIVSLKEVRDWCRIDEEDTVIQLLIDKAEIEIEKSIDNYDIKIKNPKFVKLAKLDILKQISFDYDHRDRTAKGKDNNTFVGSRTQMQYCNFE